MRLAALVAVVGGACSQGPGPRRGSDGDVDAAASPVWALRKLQATARVQALRGVGSDLYVAGENGMVLRTGDGAQTWVDVSVSPASAGATLPTYPVFDAIAASAADDVWMAGASAPETGVLMHTSDRGQSWQQSDVGMVTPIDGVWSLDREHVVAATGGGQILATADGGGTWQTTFSDPHMMLWGVWGSAGGEVYVVGGVEVSANGGAYNVPVYRGVVLHSADVGMTWQNVAGAATPCILWRVSGTADGATVYAVGSCGSVAATTDHGASWSISGAVRAGQDYAITDVWVSPTGTSHLLPAGPGYAGSATSLDEYVCRAVAVGDDGAVVVQKFGCELLPPKRGFTSSPIAIWGTSDDDLWVVGGTTPLWHRL